MLFKNQISDPIHDHVQIHEQALEIVSRYKKSEGELIEMIQRVEKCRIYLRRGYPSLFQYVVRDLGLTENVAYSLITVARKSIEIPEIKVRIQAGTLSLSSAKKILPVINWDNQSEWLEKAQSMSTRQLEKHVVQVKPRIATSDRASYVRGDHVKLEMGLSERAMLRLRRAQDLLSQTRKKAASLEETLEVLTNEFLTKNDPLEKAKRHRVRNGNLALTQTLSETIQDQTGNKPLKKPLSPRVAKRVQQPLRNHFKRVSVPAAILHQVNLRDQRRCTFVDRSSAFNSIPFRCDQRRWLHIHHIQPVHEGGKNTVDNLATLCQAHHRLVHL